MAGRDGQGRVTLSLVGQNTDVGFYSRRVSKLGGPALVLGCADGQVAWELCLQGLGVVGVDPSSSMLGAAEERRQIERPEVGDRLRLMPADLRSLRLPDRFPVVLAPQNALGLMATTDDLEALLATVRHHLQPGGTFLFDVVNPRNPISPWPVGPDEEVGPSQPLEPTRPVFAPHLRERKRTPGRAPGGGIRRLRMRQYIPAEVDAALGRAGLVAMERFGRFDGKPFDEADPHQIVIAQPRDAEAAKN